MKKLVLVAALALGLAGCAQLSAVTTGVSLVTKSIANPVTTNDLYEVEAAMRIVTAALNTYKKACAANAADVSCRSNVAAVQVYTRQIPPYLTQVRTFLRNNDQINAMNSYNALVGIYTTAKSTATSFGVNLGS